MTGQSKLDDLHIETLAVRAAVERSQYGENSEALYLTSGYVQPTAEAAARRFAGDEEGYTYGRYGNPTVTSMEIHQARLLLKARMHMWSWILRFTREANLQE